MYFLISAHDSSMSASTENRQAVLTALASVPAGKVVSYGDLAREAGLPGAARAIGRILRTLPKDTVLPWHRVVNARGEISIPHQGALVQRERLEAEDVVFLNGRVDMKTHRWRE